MKVLVRKLNIDVLLLEFKVVVIVYGENYYLVVFFDGYNFMFEFYFVIDLSCY